MRHWIQDRSAKSFLELTFYVLWGLWLHRDQVLFEDKKANLRLVAHLIRVAFNERRKGASVSSVKPRHGPSFTHNLP